MLTWICTVVAFERSIPKISFSFCRASRPSWNTSFVASLTICKSSAKFLESVKLKALLRPPRAHMLWGAARLTRTLPHTRAYTGSATAFAGFPRRAVMQQTPSVQLCAQHVSHAYCCIMQNWLLHAALRCCRVTPGTAGTRGYSCRPAMQSGTAASFRR